MFFLITAEIKIDSYDSLPLEKPLTLHNVIIQIKSFLNKDQNYYYSNTSLEQCSYQLAKKCLEQNFLMV